MARLLMIVMLLSIGSVQARQSDRPWIIWLTNGEVVTGMTRDGYVALTYSIPAVDGGMTHPIVSYSGRYAAYLAGLADPKDWAFQVYDSLTEQVVVNMPSQDRIWEAPFFRADWQIFDAAETRVTFGYATYEDAVGVARWQYFVFDLTSGEMLHSLRVDSEATAPGCPTCTPFTHSFVDDTIIFSLIRLGMEDFPRPYVWDLGTGEVTPYSRFLPVDASFNTATGETVFSRMDERFAAETVLDTLYVDVLSSDGCFPFYKSAEWVMQDPIFVQGGERVAFKAFFQNFSSLFVGVVEPDGDLVGFYPVADVANPNEFRYAATPDGFVYVEQTFDATGNPISRLVQVITQNPQVVVSNMDLGAGTVLAHVQAEMTPNSMTEWAVLADPTAGCAIPPGFS